MAEEKGKIVFLLDDDPFIREILPEFLSPHGFQVKVFKTFPEMMEQLDMPPAVCIVDYYLENVDGPENGVEIIKAIKKKNARIPVILLSGMEHTNLPSFLKEKTKGFRFLQKSSNLFMKLNDTLNELLEQK